MDNEIYAMLLQCCFAVTALPG